MDKSLPLLFAHVFLLPHVRHFVCACSLQIGSSLFDEEGSAIVGELMAAAEQKGVSLHLPVDHVTGDKFDKAANVSENRLLIDTQTHTHARTLEQCHVSSVCSRWGRPQWPRVFLKGGW